MIETYRNMTLFMMGILYIGSPVEAVNITILFESHFTRMVGCLWAPFVVHVERLQYTASVAYPRILFGEGGFNKFS